MRGCHYIDGGWREGSGEEFGAQDPTTGEENWRGRAAAAQEIGKAVGAARESFGEWSTTSFEERVGYVRRYEERLRGNQKELAEAISRATGKPLWEAHQEVHAMIQKIGISVEAYRERCPEKSQPLQKATLKVHYKPHGVVAVLGPFNFPGHLPNGHLVPALLAGNTVVFKGSELTPLVSEALAGYWEGLPKGVFNLVQGGALTGEYLIHSSIDALFFTGSYKTGIVLMEALRTYPEKILALEMGGNNPLVIHDAADLNAAAQLTIQSAFLSSGQRCTCARRLIIPNTEWGETFLKVLIKKVAEIQIGPYTMFPEPFMGPVISTGAAHKLLKTQNELGGIPLLEMRLLKENSPFLSPGIMDMTDVQERKDEEIFGPFLQVIRVPSLEAAIQEANNTSYGLVASICTQERAKFEQFYHAIRAGVINWNTPTTGASSLAPFGGVGKSGNHRPSGYYAADYCAYPVASMVNENMIP